MSGRTYTEEEIQEVFEMLDADGSGKLEMGELCHALNLLGVDLTDEEITTTYRIDDDPDSLSYDEFRSFVKDRIETMDIDFQQRVLDAFREFQDEEGDGTITRETLKMILTARGNNPVSEEEAEELIRECDADGNGVFDAQELAHLLCAAMDL